MATKKILVPLDGTRNSERIGDWVTGLAGSLGAEVTLVTVVDHNKIDLPSATAEHGHPIPGRQGRYDGPGGGASWPFAAATGVVGGAAMVPGNGGLTSRPPSFGTQMIEREMQQAAGYLERQAHAFSSGDVGVVTEVLNGDPAEEIVRFATENDIDMIAMATRRGSAISRGVLGSVTDKVLSAAGIPVLAVHPATLAAFESANGGPETIVVPLDGSERSESIVDIALEVAKQSEAEVLFIHVINFRHLGAGVTEDSVFNMTAVSSVHRHESEDYLIGLVERAEMRGVRAKYALLTGNPAATVIRESKSVSNPLIMMTTRGYSGIKRMAFGSVADELLRSSGLPVVVLQPIPKMMELLAKAKGIPYTQRLDNGIHSRFEAKVSTGRCPLGVKAGYAWNVEQSGKMDLPICKAAASALEGYKVDRAVCDCPYGANSVVFTASSVAS